MFDRNRTTFRVANVRGALGLAAVFSAIVFVAVFVELGVYRHLDAAAATQRHLVRAQGDLDRVLQAILDEETGLRGYLATGRPDFLEPYSRNRERFGQSLDTFERTASGAGFGALTDSVADIRSLHATWESQVALPLLRSAARKDAITRQQLGKLYVDQMRADIARDDEFLDRETGVVEEQLKKRINDALLGGLATIVAFAVVGLSFVASRAQMMEVIDRERGIVDTLQGAFRTDLETLPGSRIGAAYLSATLDASVGGDLYDVRRLDRDRALLLVADVSGKGVEAAVNTALVKYSMRTLALSSDGPATIMTAFNRVYLDTIRDPSVFVVAFVGVFDTRTLRLCYASAGHAGAYLRRGAEVSQLEVTGPIVGLDAATRYDERTLALRPGDVLMLATDGLTEARDASGALLDDAGAMALLRESSTDPQACADELVSAVVKRSGGKPADDLALLVIAVDGPQPADVPASPEAAA